MLGLVFLVWADCTMQSYHRLFGNVHQIFDIIILVLLKGGEQHVQDLLFVSSRSFALFLLFLLVLQLQKKNKQTVKRSGIMWHKSDASAPSAP